MRDEARVTYQEAEHDPCQGQTSMYMLVVGKVVPGWLKLGTDGSRVRKRRNRLQGDDEMKDEEEEEAHYVNFHTDGIEIGIHSRNPSHGRDSAFKSWPRDCFREDYELRTEDWDCETRYDVDILLCGQEGWYTHLLVLWRYGKSIPGSGLHRETKEGHPIYQRVGVIRQLQGNYEEFIIDWSKAGQASRGQWL